MQKSGTNPPYDNLTAEQLSQLLTVIKRESKQFNIVNPTTLENIVIMHLDNLADRVKGSAIQRADKAVFANFISGNIPSMRLIIRNPISSDNWFTIHAKRESNGQVSLNMYNSFSKVEKYNEALFYNICRSDIIYLYIMLTNSPDTWPCVINEELEKEIKAVCSLYTEKAKPHLEALLEDLDNFVECLSGLKDSVSNFKSRSDIRSEAPVQRIIDTLRLSALSREYTILFNNIITDFRGLNLKNPVVQEFQKFITTYALSVKDLKEKFSFLIDNKSAEEERKILTAGEMIGTLRHITDDAIALKAKIAQQPDSLTKGKFFDAAPESISYDKLEIIKKYLQPNLKAFIREQLSGATSRAKTLLFYGEPGNGKTTIAQAIAQLCPYKDETGKLKERPFRIIRAPALGTKYKHSKTEQLNSITTFIRENPYAVVLLDEIDALADSKHDQDPVVQDFQQVMDNATNVIFIGTTNSEIQATVTIDMPDQKTKPIAPALLSRFQNRIKIENPTLDHRRAIIKNCLTMLAAKDPNISITLSKQEEESLARRTAGFSIRDLETVFILAHQYVFAPHSPSDDDMSIVQYRQLTNEHIEAGVQAIEKGKRINYMHIAGIILKNVALYGSPWLSLAHALYSSYIHGLQRNEDILRLELHRGQDRVQHFSEVRDDIMRNYAIRNEGQAIHEAERAQDLYTQELQRDENWRWQVAHTAISLAGLGVQGYSALKSAK